MLTRIEQFLRETVIPQVIGAVASGKAISSQFSVTGDSGTHNQFPIWIDIMPTTTKDGGSEVPAFHARTNDMDLMVGYPPSFYTTRRTGDEQGLADDIIAYLSKELATQNSITVLLRATAAQNMPNLPLLTGDSIKGELAPQLVRSGI